MGKQTQQGTAWESRIRKRAQQHGRKARRLAKTAVKHEPDIQIEGMDMLPVVFWENWVKKPGNKRRRARRMVTMREQDFWKLVDTDMQERFGYWVQAKSTQTLSVRTILEGLLGWVEKHGQDHH